MTRSLDIQTIDLMSDTESVTSEDQHKLETIENLQKVLDFEDGGKDCIHLAISSCRLSVHKVYITGDIIISPDGIKIPVVAPARDSDFGFCLKIPDYAIKRVISNIGDRTSVLSILIIYLNRECAVQIRTILENWMRKETNLKLEETRRIILYPKYSDYNAKRQILKLYAKKRILELTITQEINKIIDDVNLKGKIGKKEKQIPNTEITRILVYPPAPAIGGVSITTEDYCCLGRDCLINDAIIDLYLKYIYETVIPEKEREKVYIFSTYFYPRLTSLNENGPFSTKAERRHNSVKKWTKKVDLFSKDFILIPICKNSHWFLVVICFLPLTGPVYMDDDLPVNENSIEDNADNNNDDDVIYVSDSDDEVTITNYNGDKAKQLASSGNKKKNLSMDEELGEDEQIFYSDPPRSVKRHKIDQLQHSRPIKQPCILVFDSLGHKDKAPVIATIRQYLSTEYQVKHSGLKKDFSNRVLKAACPQVPQQNNAIDCGLYLLQYGEFFFTKKITNYNLPITSLENWFPSINSIHKRLTIQSIILKLMKKQNENKEFPINLPLLSLYTVPDNFNTEIDPDEASKWTLFKSINLVSKYDIQPQSEPVAGTNTTGTNGANESHTLSPDSTTVAGGSHASSGDGNENNNVSVELVEDAAVENEQAIAQDDDNYSIYSENDYFMDDTEENFQAFNRAYRIQNGEESSDDDDDDDDDDDAE